MISSLDNDLVHSIWRALFRGFIQVHILHHASEEPVYGMWLIGELARHGYVLSPGTLYPLLHRMEASGLLVHHDQVVEGKRRRYYTITADGRDALAVARRQALQLVAEVSLPSTLAEDEGATP